MSTTAIQGAIHYVQNLRNSSKITDPSEYGRWIAMEYMLKELLPVEKEQIEQAFIEGAKYLESCKINPAIWKAEMKASEYYATTYQSAAPVTEQSDEDYVKSVYPDAECSYVSMSDTLNLGQYSIYENEYTVIAIGKGDTEQSAWSSAADRIRKAQLNLK